jgi:hypothetical protein
MFEKPKFFKTEKPNRSLEKTECPALQASSRCRAEDIQTRRRQSRSRRPAAASRHARALAAGRTRPRATAYRYRPPWSAPPRHAARCAVRVCATAPRRHRPPATAQAQVFWAVGHPRRGQHPGQRPGRQARVFCATPPPTAALPAAGLAAAAARGTPAEAEPDSRRPSARQPEQANRAVSSSVSIRV